MGPVRHHHLIRLLSFAVAFNLCVAVVVLYARGDGLTGAWNGPLRVAAAGSPAGSAAPVVVPGAGRADGVLAGARFAKRRGAKGRTASPGAAAAAAAPAPAPAKAEPAATPVNPPTDRTPVDVAATQGEPEKAGAAGAAGADGGAGGPRMLPDRAGDTVDDGTGEAIAEGRADIVQAGGRYEPGRVTLTLQVRQPTDPATDGRWVSESTYAVWEVDTDGDATADYEVQFFFVEGSGPDGIVSRPGDDGETVCDVAAANFTAGGYEVTVDPACLGRPASFSHRAAIYYDTDPADGDAAVAHDVAPDGGWSFGVSSSG